MLVISVPLTAYAQQGGGSERETAITVAPAHLALDGSKSYAILAACVWGGHTYGIGLDATATEDLGKADKYAAPGSVVTLPQAGLGWTLTQTNAGLVIENQGRYLTVFSDRKSLAISTRKTASGLTITPNGMLALADTPTETVYLQRVDSDPEPQAGQRFGITDKENKTVFYFVEIQDQSQPSSDVIFPELLPLKNFRAKIVSPNQVYGDDQYVIFTVNAGRAIAVTGSAACSSPLKLDKQPAVGVTLTSPDQNTLWTVNNNRAKSAPSGTTGYYKYIRSCASNKYMAANTSLLDENIQCDFFLADQDGSSALLATQDGRYVTLDGNAFTVTRDRNAASRFYFAKLLPDEQQTADSTTAIPTGSLMRLVDWADVETGKTYAIISATEFNKMHYALSGNGRLARYGADNLTNNSLCPNEHASGLYGVPCKAAKGDVFYTNGQDILWTASVPGKNQAVFKNIATNLYLKVSEGTAAEQTPSISATPATITIEPVNGQVYAYLRSDAGKYLGIWQYVAVGVSQKADERCAYYLAEVLDTQDIKDLPATALKKDWDQSTVSFGGLYSIYQGSQHLLTDATGVENFILMDDGTGSFKPSSAEYSADGKNNYYVTYCADYEAAMPIFTAPGQYKAVSLEDYEGFSAAQKAALGAVIPRCYPYVTKDEFLASLKKAGYKVSKDCGTDEIMAGIQAVIYNITNPRPDGESWGYESSEGWAHNSYEVNKPASYVSDPAQAERDVNTVRDYLWSFVKPAVNAKKVVSRAAKTDSGFTELEGDYFAITTEINGHTWALGYSSNYYATELELMPYNSDDIRQMWCKDEHGSLRWVPYVINHDEKDEYAPALYFFRSIDGDDDSSFAWSTYSVLPEPYSCSGYIPLMLDETNGRLMLNDYENKLSTVQWKANKVLNISIDQWALDREDRYYQNGWAMSLDVHSIFVNGTNKVTFKKESVTPRFPHFLDYDIKDSEWKVTDNGDGTYNITVSGHLNYPVRDEIDYVNVIMSPDSKFPSDYKDYRKWYYVMPGEDEFTFKVDNIPDSEEVHFCLMISEEYRGIEVFVPQNTGWQLQIGWLVNYADKEIHELTTSLTAKKAWADEKDHSKDKVELCLVENDRETSYKVTLSAENGWEGKFKHVPYKRWTYNEYGSYGENIEIPLVSHQYTVKELNVKPGYTPSYTVEVPEGTAVLEQLSLGKSYPVQVAYTTAEGDIMAFYASGNGFTMNYYYPGAAYERLFINGNEDGTGVLISRQSLGYRPYPIVYPFICFEEANEDGKYHLYTNGYGEKWYLKLSDDGIDGTKDKREAMAVELRDFETGDVLTTLPTDIFQPFETALKPYENGQLMEQALDLQDGFSQYDPENPLQKFKVYSYNGQLVALTDLTPDIFFQLDPCHDELGQYFVRVNGSNNYELSYLGMDEDGRLMSVEKMEDAVRVGLMSFPSENIGAMGGNFKVTNAPGASLEVSKTVSGAGVDQSKAFTFTVTLGDQTINGTFGGMTFQNGVAAFTLKHGQKKTATGLPAGITYEVAETDNAGYTVTVNGGSAADGKATGSLVADQVITLAFNNGTAGAIPQTGDPMNTALWLAMLAVSALVLVALFVTRKKMGGNANENA